MAYKNKDIFNGRKKNSLNAISHLYFSGIPEKIIPPWKLILCKIQNIIVSFEILRKSSRNLGVSFFKFLSNSLERYRVKHYLDTFQKRYFLSKEKYSVLPLGGIVMDPKKICLIPPSESPIFPRYHHLT